MQYSIVRLTNYGVPFGPVIREEEARRILRNVGMAVTGIQFERVNTLEQIPIQENGNGRNHL